MDSSVSPTHGEQEQSVWNGHFGYTCYHPLFVFNQFGDLERCALRPGNVHSADNWEAVLKPVVARYKREASRICFRGDAAFAMPSMYEYLESEGIDYAIRLPANQILQIQMAEVAVPGDIFADLQERIAAYARARLPRQRETRVGHPIEDPPRETCVQMTGSSALLVSCRRNVGPEVASAVAGSPAPCGFSRREETRQRIVRPYGVPA